MPVHGITALYQPFSFKDYIEPIISYQERFDKIQDDLASRYDEVGTWKGLVDPNSTAGKTLTQYEQLLNQTAQDLATNGLKTVSRNTLFDLKRMYSSQISPIKNAAANYADIRDSVRKAAVKDPTLIVTGMPTIEDLMQNPNAYPSMVSGAALAKAGEDATDSFVGLTPKSVGEFLQGNYEAIPQGGKAILDIAGQYGNNSPEAIQAILSGMATGLGKQLAKQEEADRKFQERILLKQMSGKRSGRSGGKSGGSRTSTKNPTEPYNPTAETIEYNTDGTVYERGNKIEVPENYEQRPVLFNELTKEEKLIALKHAFINISEDESLSDEDIDRIVRENREKLNMYRYYRIKGTPKKGLFKKEAPEETRLRIERAGSKQTVSAKNQGTNSAKTSAEPADEDVEDTVSEELVRANTGK